jgi:trans-aconitate methyltransferase
VPIQYTDPDADVPPGVDFLDAEQVHAWVRACELDKPWRLPMRSRFAELVATLPPRSRVLELGSGPGLLAECILDRCPNLASYTLLDYSDHMLSLSRERLQRFPMAQFVNANFKTPEWTAALSPPYTAVIAMQAVHEIRHKRHVPGLYQRLRQVLSPGGMVAVCDGTPEEGSALWRRSLCLTLEEQIDALAAAGFTDVVHDNAIGSMVLVVGRVSL